MKIYHVTDSYINYLRQFDSKVLLNKDGKRPYIGVVMEINSINYYVPLSSPKPKHKTMKNGKDFHKIKQGEYGAINFNLMIPVPSECLIQYDVENESDEKYKKLVQHQFVEIINMQDIIKNKANKLYLICTGKITDISNKDREMINRCVNFTLLEEKLKEYNN